MVAESIKHKSCLVTGASSGIGRAIADMLYDRGYNVFGIGRDFKFAPEWNSISLELTDTDKLIETTNELIKNNEFEILVNCAGCAYYGLTETIDADKISAMVRTNVEVPMILTGIFTKAFKAGKGGYIFNISSVTADGINTHGAVYGATKAALTSFSRSVFEESRKHGVKVIDIQPDMTDTELYRNANFTCDDDMAAHLEPKDVAGAISDVLDMREGVVATRIRLQPQLHRIKKKDDK